MEGEQCFICSKPAALRCGECGAVYCGHHAKYHLHPDTGRCFPFSVARVAGVGRVLLAAADLAPGDEIFREEEMVVGPSRRITAWKGNTFNAFNTFQEARQGWYGAGWHCEPLGHGC